MATVESLYTSQEPISIDGEKLKEGIISRGLTLTELSYKTNLSISRILAYEGQVEMPLGHFLKINSVLKFPLSFYKTYKTRCEYCQLGEYNKPLITDNWGVELAWINAKNELEALDEYDDESYTVEISNCPKCGRELNS